MTTTSARMYQRRRTVAQFASENPVLGPGEIGVATGGPSAVLQVGDGVTAWNSLPGIDTGHEALYTYARDMDTNGTPLAGVANQDTVLPRITLADAVTQRCKWVWAIPVKWNGVAVRWGSTPEAAGGGNVKWQFAYKLIYLGESNVDGAVTATITIAAIAAGGQFAFTYNLPSETASIATATGGLGDKPFMLCSLARLGGDAADTYVGGVSVSVATATRIS